MIAHFLVLLVALAIAPAYAATLFLNANSAVAAGSRTGSSTALFLTLAEAWSALPASSASNLVRLVLAPGRYALPTTPRQFGNVFIVHEPATPSGAPVQIVADPAHASTQGPLVTLNSGVNLTWSGVTFATFDPTSTAVMAIDRWSTFAVKNGALLTIDACNIVGSSGQALFRTTASGTGSITVQESIFSSTSVDLAITDSAQLKILRSRMSRFTSPPFFAAGCCYLDCFLTD
ncbi:hypothetical protein GGF32_001020 [Allomyces javanicus]|nr:hypothetical protein GGF32_001020 [Allomyces javanicus]